VETKRKTGTKEWAPHSLNIFMGCTHNCRYCYARRKALDYGRITSAGQWPDMKLNEKAFNRKPRKLDGRIMFPTTHDLLPQHRELIKAYLVGWLEAGNEFLITTKPHVDVVSYLLKELLPYRDRITWRFTIGSLDDETLGFWEPGAPLCSERFAALAAARIMKFTTSASCEPYLDNSVTELIEELLAFVDDTIWVGKMNAVKSRVDTTGWAEEDFKFLKTLEVLQSGPWVRTLYADWRDNPKVHWKDSIKRVLGLPEEETG